MIATILILGGGQAGAQAIDTLRREGFKGRLVLVGDEDSLPYQRPPLSKKFLSGEMAAERLLFRHRAFYDEHAVELKLGTRAIAVQPETRRVVLSSGEELRYDRLLLCLGAIPRRLSCPGADLRGVHYLRTAGDAAEIRAGLAPGARVVIIGGGYIGLETAATARGMGCAVTVLEMADRIMNRVVASNVSEYFAHEHRSQGVRIVCNARVVSLAGSDRVESVACADGSLYPADLLIAGVGALPNTQLARDAGLKCDNGIVVDEHCRTSDPEIYAAGDCTNYFSPRYQARVRLESVDNAFEQSRAAASNILGRPAVHDRVPWFWSDQYDNKLLIVGISSGHDQQVTRGDPAGRSFSVCYLKGGELLAVEAVNHSKDYMAARRLIPERLRPNIDRLADHRIGIKDTGQPDDAVPPAAGSPGAAIP
ncbi:MAG TPA: FAD-dependent oxidoreductase [Steroidobacteraceae bacterium]|jgi:3-phenylpropionate/trans-cinnamate dioxygenase ferredoxin reductase subunit|nr:FAD-dependent oxidoreductase [Steroidobacteraceae bacterium]